jgi:hypothetical protein
VTGPKPGSDEAPRYEHRDANVRWLLVSGVSLCVLIFLTLLGVAVVMPFLVTLQPAGRTASPLATRDVPPEPRLQIDPHLDLARKRSADDAQLASYGWVDRPSGTVRIPIDRAMELLAERDHAARDGADANASKPSARVASPKRSSSR